MAEEKRRIHGKNGNLHFSRPKSSRERACEFLCDGSISVEDLGTVRHTKMSFFPW